MKTLAFLCVLAVASIANAQQAPPTTDQARRISSNGADRWDFWTKLPRAQAGLARETGQPLPQQFNQGFNNGGRRRGFFRRRR